MPHFYERLALTCPKSFLLVRFGAGNEFGKDMREEARRKKLGIVAKKHKPDSYPWLMRVGGKNGKKSVLDGRWEASIPLPTVHTHPWYCIFYADDDEFYQLNSLKRLILFMYQYQPH